MQFVELDEDLVAESIIFNPLNVSRFNSTDIPNKQLVRTRPIEDCDVQLIDDEDYDIMPPNLQTSITPTNDLLAPLNRKRFINDLQEISRR